MERRETGAALSLWAHTTSGTVEPAKLVGAVTVCTTSLRDIRGSSDPRVREALRIIGLCQPADGGVEDCEKAKGGALEPGPGTDISAGTDFGSDSRAIIGAMGAGLSGSGDTMWVDP
jgi:hypothetical protein